MVVDFYDAPTPTLNTDPDPGKRSSICLKLFTGMASLSPRGGREGCGRWDRVWEFGILAFVRYACDERSWRPFYD